MNLFRILAVSLLFYPQPGKAQYANLFDSAEYDKGLLTLEFKINNYVQAGMSYQLKAAVFTGKIAVGANEYSDMDNTYDGATQHVYFHVGAAPVLNRNKDWFSFLGAGFFVCFANEQVNFHIKDIYGSTYYNSYSKSKTYSGFEFDYITMIKVYKRLHISLDFTFGVCFNPGSALENDVPRANDIFSNLPGQAIARDVIFNVSGGLAYGFWPSK